MSQKPRQRHFRNPYTDFGAMHESVVVMGFERPPASLGACCKLPERAGVRNPSHQLP